MTTQGGPVARLAALAVREASEATLLGAFVAAGRQLAQAEREGDIRDGLIEMPLPFRSARKLGLDADGLVDRAAEHLDDREEELLRVFAARDDRDDVEAMNYVESWGEDGFVYRWRG